MSVEAAAMLFSERNASFAILEMLVRREGESQDPLVREVRLLSQLLASGEVDLDKARESIASILAS